MLDSIIKICRDYANMEYRNRTTMLNHILDNYEVDEWDDCSYTKEGLKEIKWFLNSVLDFINEHNENVFNIDGQKIVGSIFKNDIEKIEDLIIKIELIISQDNEI